MSMENNEIAMPGNQPEVTNYTAQENNAEKTQTTTSNNNNSSNNSINNSINYCKNVNRVTY